MRGYAPPPDFDYLSPAPLKEETTHEEWAMIQRIQSARISDPDPIYGRGPKKAPALMREAIEQATSEKDKQRRIELMRRFFYEFDKVMEQEGAQQAERPT